MTNFKTPLLAAGLCLATLASTGQTAPNGSDPAVANVNVNPAPVLNVGDDLAFFFDIGNNGPGNISGIGSDTKNRIACRVEFSYAQPNPLSTAALSGSALNVFDFRYDPATNAFIGLQKEGVAINEATYTHLNVALKVTQLSRSLLVNDIGGAVTIQTCSNCNPQVTSNDNASVFTHSLNLLPATGMELKATLTAAGNANLVWETLTEANTSYFEVQRSNNGTNYLPVGKVNAAGNSNVSNSYFFTDTVKVDGIAYYRVRLHDKDGKSRLSNIVPLVKKLQKGIAVFPNPAHNLVTVTGLTDKQTMVLYDVSGNQLKQLTGAGTNRTINIETWPTGTYLLSVVEEGKPVYTTRFIKQ